MPTKFRAAHLVLALGFLATIGGVPLGQVLLEIVRNEPIQATDLVRYVPTVKNLRDFEQALEASWWGQDTVRPITHRLLYHALGETGTAALPGRTGWLFYRPGVQYLELQDHPAAVAGCVIPNRGQAAGYHLSV